MNVNHATPVRYPGLGNGLAANRDLGAGDVIIGISNPFLIVVENAALDRVCSECLFETPGSLKRCTACKVAQYCSVTCQSVAWKSIHKEECRIYKKLPQVAPTAVRGLIQLLLRKEISALAPDSRWAELEGHAAELQKHNRWDEIVLQARAAVEWTASPQSYMEPAVHVLCRVCLESFLGKRVLTSFQMATNAFRATLADNTPIGLCFEPMASLANHSCVPNATIMFDGRHMTLRALDDIKMGEQVFISYIDGTQTKVERQQELADRYFFKCQCEKCEQDNGPYRTFLKSHPTLDSKLELFHTQKEVREVAQARSSDVPPVNIENFQPEVNRLLSRSRDPSITSAQRLAFLTEALAVAKPLRHRGQFAQSPCPFILHELYLHYLANDSTYAQALSLILFIYLNSDVYNYPQPHHPIRVTRLFTIAKLLKNIEGLKTTDVVSANQTLLLCVRRLAARSHGPESRFMKEVEEEIKDVETVQKTRGEVGARLQEWERTGVIAETDSGREYARKIFEGLRDIAKDGLDGAKSEV